MSMNEVKNFFDKVEVDKELQVKMKAMAEKQKAQRDELFTELVTIATGMGYDFTVDDFATAVVEARVEVPEDELKPLTGSARKQCGTFDLLFYTECTCGYSSPCKSSGLA